MEFDKKNFIDPAVKDDFLKALQGARLSGSEKVYTNRAPWQTTIATLELLEYALSLRRTGAPVEVCIVSGTATELFYSANGIVEELEECLRNGCVVKILVWNDAAHPPGKTLGTLSKKYSNLKLHLSGTRERGEELPHFLVVNGRAYRLELNHKYFDNEVFTETTPETKASICFNDEGVGGGLANMFNVMWDERLRI